jgi:hypothetical protein
VLVLFVGAAFASFTVSVWKLDAARRKLQAEHVQPEPDVSIAGILILTLNFLDFLVSHQADRLENYSANETGKEADNHAYHLQPSPGIAPQSTFECRHHFPRHQVSL